MNSKDQQIAIIVEDKEDVEFKIEEFKKKYKERYPLNQPPTDNFLIWFIGFVEGDGCFLRTNRNDLMFIVTQGIADIEVLNEIQSNFGFGKITSQGTSKRVWRFVVQDLLNIELIILLFNGNIVLPTRQKRFTQFLEVFNAKIEKGKKVILFNKIEYKKRNIKISLNNAWLSGFTDSEGCFSVSMIKSTSLRIKMSYTVTQKGDENVPKLSNLIRLFETGVIEAHSQKHTYSYRIWGVTNIITKMISKQYFEKYPLRTTKQKSYLLWLNLINKIKNKEHLNSTNIEELQLEAKAINSIRRK